jgi:hypothetical protein
MAGKELTQFPLTAIPPNLIADLFGYYAESTGILLRRIVLAGRDGNTLAPFFTGVADGR